MLLGGEGAVVLLNVLVVVVVVERDVESLAYWVKMGFGHLIWHMWFFCGSASALFGFFRVHFSVYFSFRRVTNL